MFPKLKILSVNCSSDVRDQIPNTLHGLNKVILCSGYDESIDYLPDSVKHIEFKQCSCNFATQYFRERRFERIINKLPKKLEYLKLPKEYKLTNIHANIKMFNVINDQDTLILYKK